LLFVLSISLRLLLSLFLSHTHTKEVEEKAKKVKKALPASWFLGRSWCGASRFWRFLVVWLSASFVLLLGLFPAGSVVVNRNNF
jgi:hypothetical protein